MMNNMNRIAAHPFSVIYLLPANLVPDTERRVSALAQQCVNIKKDVLQFVINDREFKQTAIQWGYDKMKGGSLS